MIVCLFTVLFTDAPSRIDYKRRYVFCLDLSRIFSQGHGDCDLGWRRLDLTSRRSSASFALASAHRVNVPREFKQQVNGSKMFIGRISSI